MRHLLHISITLALAFALCVWSEPVSARSRKPAAKAKTTAQAKAAANAKNAAIEASNDNLLIDAVQAYLDRKYQVAFIKLCSLIEKDQTNDAAYYYRAQCYIRANAIGDAALDLKKAISLDPSNFWYKELLARLYAASRQDDLAVASYEGLLEEYPKKTDIYYTLANLYIDQGNLEKALETIDNIETQFGKSDGTVITKYNILRHQNKGEEAIKELQEYNSEYSSPQVLSMLGDYELNAYNDSTALEYYDQALSLDKSYTPAFIGKIEAYRLSRKYDEYFKSLKVLMADKDASSAGKADYLKALTSEPKFTRPFLPQLDSVMDVAVATHPDDSLMLYTAGVYYLQTGRGERSVDIFKHRKDIYPDNVAATAQYIQILLYQEQPDYAKVIAECDSALVKFPKELDFYSLANNAHYSTENWQAIIDNCGKILKAAPTDSAAVLYAWTMTGDMYHLLNETVKSYKAYENALAVNPDYAPVLNNYAYYLSVEGKKLKQAYAMSKKTVEAEPDNATYLDTFGWILYLQGKAMEAKPFFKHAMLYGGKESATILNHYATVLEALGEDDLARVYRQQAKNKAKEGKD